jgi:hypothetical protein
VFMLPVPAVGAPCLSVRTNELGWDARRGRETLHTLVMVADADLGGRERSDPLPDPLAGLLVLPEGCGGIVALGVERDRVPVENVADQHHFVASPAAAKNPHEPQIAGVFGGDVDVAYREDSCHVAPIFSGEKLWRFKVGF